MLELYAFNLLELLTRLVVMFFYTYFVIKTSRLFFEIDLLREIKNGNTAVAIFTAALFFVGALVIALFQL